MKITYYSYCLELKKQKYHYDIRRLLETFCRFDDNDFKARFTTESAEQMYLFYAYDDIYLFAVTKSNEIIKAINSRELAVKDIHEKLNSDEYIGFASYVVVKPYVYGIASTFYGPKNTRFVEFINAIIREIRQSQFLFLSYALPAPTTKDEALALPVKGRTVISLGAGHPVVGAIKEYFGIETCEIDTLTLTISPKKRGNLGKSFDKILNGIQLSPDVKRYVVRARAELEDMVTDFYLVGNGYISDIIDHKNEAEIYEKIKSKVSGNLRLHDIIEELKSDPEYKTATSDFNFFDSFGKLSTWSHLFALD